MASEILSPWLTIDEAARYARVAADTISRWIGEGRLKPAVTRNKKNLRGRGAAGYLIEQCDLDTLLRSLKVNVAEAEAPAPEKAGAKAAPRPRPEPFDDLLKRRNL